MKGQSNLFSFFKKTTPSTPGKSDGQLNSGPQTSTSTPSKSPIILEKAAKSSSPIATPAKSQSTPSPSSTKSNPKKRTIIEDDEEEWQDNDEKDNLVDTEEEESDKDDNFVSDEDDFETETKSKNKKSKKSIGIASSSRPLSKSASSSKPPRPPSKSTPSSSSSYTTPSKSATRTPSTPTSPSSLLESPSTTPSTPSSSSEPLPEGVFAYGLHEHHSWSFNLPQNRRDKSGKRPDHPEYNPRTLYVPPEEMKKQTPAMAQWWSIKSENMDTVLFFKVGKFYELFHMDADVGMKELDLIYMKGPKAHSGFPEVSYGKFASILVNKGYRVARVEQTETPDMLKERNDRGGGKKDKVVLREVCSVLSKGTRTYCHLDDLSLLTDEGPAGAGRGGGIGGESGSVLFCVKEGWSELKSTETSSSSSSSSSFSRVPEYGVCCVDTMLGKIVLAQFQDDSFRSRLRTMACKYLPSEVVWEDQAVSAEALGVMKLIAPRAAYDSLRRVGGEVMSGEETLKVIQDRGYFHHEEEVGENPPVSQDTLYPTWPPILRAAAQGLEDGSSSLVVEALGLALWQLRRSLIDFEILSLGQVFAYVPPEEDSVNMLSSHEDEEKRPAFDPHALSLSCPLVSVEHDPFLAEEPTSESPSSSTTTTTSSSLPQSMSSNESPSPSTTHMTLDAIALSNLEILLNNSDHSSKGSLLSFLDRTKTPFGKRMLKEWIVRPLFRPKDISVRARAVEELLTGGEESNSDMNEGGGDEVPIGPEEVGSRVNPILKTLPDLERLLSRVHSNGLRIKGAGAGGGGGSKKGSSSKSTPNPKGIPEAHPDSRAVMYETSIYNSRKIRDFADVLSGFEAILKIAKICEQIKFRSPLLRKILRDTSMGGIFPIEKMSSLLTHFREIFDEKQAKKDGNIKPLPGVSRDYDRARQEISELESFFENYLRKMKKETGINEMSYFGTGKDRFQLEVPMGMANRVPNHWTTKSQKKSHRRYWTEEIESKLSELQSAEEQLSLAQKDTLRGIFEKFDFSRDIWSGAVRCVAVLDCLLSLADVSRSPGYVWPHILPRKADNPPVLDIQGGRHPMLEYTMSQKGEGEYIPNSLVLGGLLGSSDMEVEDNEATTTTPSLPEYLPRLLLLTGPNMGGKSTLLRQTCLISIMAQIGCRVPADSVTMTPVDRIFTRVGAADRILAGQSTFFVELAETALILKHASQDSLCILDELGRGTATFDGTAIAHSVVDFLVSRTRCRGLFATHYHTLVTDWGMDPRIRLGHMDCFVQCEEGEGDGEEGSAGEGGLIAMTQSSTPSTQSSTHSHSSPHPTEKDVGRSVTFLYRLCDGSSPRSYGINVARLARLPPEVIEIAIKQSLNFELKMKSSDEERKSRSETAIGIGMGMGMGVGVEMNVSFFERLMSILTSEMSEKELCYHTSELWTRFRSINHTYQEREWNSLSHELHTSLEKEKNLIS